MTTTPATGSDTPNPDANPYRLRQAAPPDTGTAARAKPAPSRAALSAAAGTLPVSSCVR
ncbi:hypothetical protein [Catellatospora paridis]|uniref:hypothetical protein n=1 Tax=Catellatospora paridis TaxID=1617086 RepID=UPI0012D3FA83|nr:hypothetical protein [Catellatospora paridis]